MLSVLVIIRLKKVLREARPILFGFRSFLGCELHGVLERKWYFNDPLEWGEF